jgi:hypothetical protein
MQNLKTNFFKKNFFKIFLISFFLIGFFASLNTGLSFDEWVEQKIWEYNVALVKNILFGVELDPLFVDYPPKYYGAGFQIISQPIQFLLGKFVLIFQNVDIFGAHLLSKHAVIFVSFFISGIFVYLIISKIISDIFFCKFVTLLYLLYPYLLGHGLFNPKDIPFLCFWVVCTYVSINIFTELTKDESIKYKDVLLISFLSAFLLSIRISGVLIFLQYLFTLIIFLNLEKLKFTFFLRKNYKKFLSFVFLTIIFSYLFYPVFWKNPLLFFDAINTMSNHWNNVCTLTLGKCMYSKNLDPLYIPIWLLVKLPTIILIGFILLPFTEKKIFLNKKSNITFGTLLFSSIFIPALLILKKVYLYDELRQILFLIPLIFIIGSVSFYIFSKKIFYLLSFITILIFVIENIKIYPYQYVWFNTPARALNLTKNFELEYIGLSGRDLAKNIIILNKEVNPKPCILVSPPWLIQSFLDSSSYSCFGLWQEIDSDFPRPFWAVQNVRNIKKGRSYKCNIVYESKFSLLFSKENIVTGKLLKCT